MKQELIHWLLNYPDSAYESIKASTWLKQKIKAWDKIRVWIAERLMGNG